MQTADSNIINIIWIKIIKCMYIPELIELFPNNVINKWPAIMFAVSRIASDPGRIKFLIVSIHTMKGIKIAGVPIGTRWQNMWFVLFKNPNKIKANHRGKARPVSYTHLDVYKRQV